MGGTMRLDPDFAELLGLLLEREVRFLVVGGYAVAAHGHPRYTGDLDLWLLVDPGNAASVVSALEDFGFSALGLTEEDFLRPAGVVQLGYPPLRIDLLTSVDGLDFSDCWPRRVHVGVNGLDVPFIGRSDLLRNKRASGRLQDLADLEALVEGEGPSPE